MCPPLRSTWLFHYQEYTCFPPLWRFELGPSNISQRFFVSYMHLCYCVKSLPGIIMHVFLSIIDSVPLSHSTCAFIFIGVKGRSSFKGLYLWLFINNTNMCNICSRVRHESEYWIYISFILSKFIDWEMYIYLFRHSHLITRYIDIKVYLIGMHDQWNKETQIYFYRCLACQIN